MAARSESDSAQYKWIRTSRFERRYELRDAAEAVCASLEFPELLGREARARAGTHEWTLSTEGWLRPCVLADATNSRERAAQVGMRWLGWAGRGTVTLADGRQFAWGPTSLLHDRRWAFVSAASGREEIVFEKPVLQQAGNNNLLCARVRIDASFQDHGARELLTVLSMYLQG